MIEKDLEVLITLDDPGEDELGEDTFHNLHAESSGQAQEGGDLSSKQE